MCELCNSAGLQHLTRRRVVVSSVAGAAALGLAVGVRGHFGARASEGETWTYEDQDAWGDLKDPESPLCSSGREQSPIDLVAEETVDLPDVDFGTTTLSPISLANNGHTIKILPQDVEAYMIDGIAYKPIEIHFHTPSEHTFDGKLEPMEYHIVHKSEDGKLAVFGVVLREGAENAALKVFFDNLPTEKADAKDFEGTILLTDLMPENRTAFMYSGSLTTPPCAEGVRWNVFVEPMEASKEQIAAYAAIFPNSNRDIQDLNERDYIMGE